MSGDIKTVKHIVEKSKDSDALLNGRDEKTGDSALHLACDGGHREIVQYLLDKVFTPLFRAFYYAVVKFLMWSF